ncbi:hypothetical protein FM21_34865 [Streptomyces mutabilis]|uniref:FtsK domain-containing protein n=1 Tax=Streptomyces mutabilis TaxID=67332 RepID=A0A086MRD3_9ACTN|nr:hypothetical protein FM21_34865 [Streptomyces mutabilis]
MQLTSGAVRTAARGSEHPLIGLDAEGNAVHLTPGDGHVLIVAPPGAGTTELLRTLGVQALAAGHHLGILDVHHVEHTWARELERVTYVDDPDHLHRHLLGLAHQSRNRALQGRPGPRRLLLVESDGTTTTLLDHQADPRPNGVALDALTAVLAHGRPAGIQVVLACRDIPDALRHLTRDLFSTRLLNAPSERTWISAGLSSLPMPDGPAPRPGLWHHLTRDGTHRFVQAARISEHVAADYARLAACPTKESDR